MSECFSFPIAKVRQAKQRAARAARIGPGVEPVSEPPPGADEPYTEDVWDSGPRHHETPAHGWLPSAAIGRLESLTRGGDVPPLRHPSPIPRIPRSLRGAPPRECHPFALANVDHAPDL